MKLKVKHDACCEAFPFCDGKHTPHTAGPWRHDEVWNLIYGPNNEEIAAIHAADCGQAMHGKRVKRGVAADNAARIVSCVNACAGLADPAADLAALREALQDCLERLTAYGSKGLSFPITEAKARAALARTEGGKE